MVVRKNDDISMLFNFKSGYKINIAYETEYENEETRNICVSPRRKYEINIKKGTDVYLVVSNLNKAFYTIEKLTFDENGAIKLAPILDRLGIERTPSASEFWNMWKTPGGKVSSEIVWFDRGYYTVECLWMDCEVWIARAYIPKGVSISGKTLKGIWYEQLDNNMEPGFYDFLVKMLSEGCSTEEYEEFKKQFIKDGSGYELKEYFE